MTEIMNEELEEMITLTDVTILGKVLGSPIYKTTAKGRPFMTLWVQANVKGYEGKITPNYFEWMIWSDRLMDECKSLNKGDRILTKGDIKSSLYNNRAGERKASYSLFLNNFSYEHKEEASAPDFIDTGSVTIDNPDLPF